MLLRVNSTIWRSVTTIIAISIFTFLIFTFLTTLPFQFGVEQPSTRNSQANISQPRQHRFTFEHAFYATTGGFVCFYMDDNGKISQRPLKFTAEGVQFLMEHEPDLIPDIALTSITDRSKSNSLGKALLLVQVVWFCVNCGSRLRERLPLSLLEVSTLAHGLCTLASYVAWWSKPLNIDEPTWITMSGEHARQALALALVLHRDWDEGYSRLLSATQDLSIQKTRLALKAAERYRLSLTNLMEYDGDCLISFDSLPRFESLFVAVGLGGGLSYYIATASIPIIYGLLHFLGWHAGFPNDSRTTPLAHCHCGCHVVRSSRYCTFFNQ